MPSSTASMPRGFARRLLAYETGAGKPAGAKGSPAFRVCEKLRGPLGRLIGVAGFRSLFSRAVAIGCKEIPWLCELQTKADGSLDGLDELEARLEAGAIDEGEVILVGQLLGLLVLFIGPALTLGLLHEIWPDWKIEELWQWNQSYEQK